MGIRILLDTHIFLWLLAAPEKIGADTLGVLRSRENSLLVSAVSALEVSTKVRVGKLEAPGLLEFWSERVRGMAADELNVTSRHATLAGSLRWEHRDPFDRLLVAQAILEDAMLATVDQELKKVPGVRTLTW